MNYWKDVDSGPDPPHKLYAVIENIRGSHNYYQYDLIHEAFMLEKVIYSHILFDEGLIPRTILEKVNPLRSIVFVNQETFPGCVVPIRPIGFIKIVKLEKTYSKLISVGLNDPLYEDLRTTSNLTESMKNEVLYQIEYVNSFSDDSTTTRVNWSECGDALKIVSEAMKKYSEGG
jgi:inorganic pyrophosphatase